MKFIVVLCISFVVCSSLRTVSADNKSLILRNKRDTDETASHTRDLIKKLVRKLRDSANQAIEAFENFNDGIKEEIKLYVEKINAHRQKLKKRIIEAIKKVADKLHDANEEVTTCIESYRGEADALIDETYAKSRACADDRIKEVKDMIDDLIKESNTALDYSKNVLEKMRNCSIDDDGSILNVSQCLSPLTSEAQTTGALFAVKSGISILRINKAIGALPAAFEMCAGFNMMRATVGTAKIIFDIGRCSAKSFITSFLKS